MKPNFRTSLSSVTLMCLSQVARAQSSAPPTTPFGGSPVASSSSSQNTEPRPETSSSDESNDDVFRLGPVVGVGLPSLISIGGMFKITRFIGGGVNVGLIPTTKISFYGEATLSYQEYDVYGRLFPFGGGFFLGAGVGYANVEGTLKNDFDTSNYQTTNADYQIPNPLIFESEGTVRTMIFTPQVGYFYTSDIGLSVGLDIGAQVPIAPSDVEFNSHLSLPPNTPVTVTSAIQTDYIDPADKHVADTLKTLARTPLPTINLRFGWLF